MKSKKAGSKNRRGLLWMYIGAAFLLAALLLTAYNIWEGLHARHTSTDTVTELREWLPDGAGDESAGEAIMDEGSPAPDYMKYPDMEMPVKTMNGIEYVGILSIPVLQIELPIANQWSYPNLKIAPCRYSGSAYQNNLIICAHNYASHFGMIKNLRAGDLAVFTDMDGNEFIYHVVDREVLNPSDIPGMEAGYWDLTLFTCTIGGKSRVVIRFEQIDP